MYTSAHVRQSSINDLQPLSTILNFDRLFGTPHTAEQVAVLWNAYHVSRSGGSGLGYLSAAIPADKYEKMLSVAKPYNSFLLPLPREDAQVSEEDVPTEASVRTPTEFFYMQWDFHGSPPDPLARDDPFLAAKPSNLPPTSTILFTPLAEYQAHNSFATPHMVITHYTDLVQTHGLVLLRGEITPLSTHRAGGEAMYHLAQHHAQALALGVQKFYLWSSGSSEREELLKNFHERPQEFKWEDLIRLSETTP